MSEHKPKSTVTKYEMPLTWREFTGRLGVPEGTDTVSISDGSFGRAFVCETKEGIVIAWDREERHDV